MSDLIYRQDALEAMSCISDSICEAEAVDALCELPTIDAVPVIRCKDCIYFTPEKSGEHWNVCRFYDAPKTADGYCNDAERKEE